MNENQRVFLDAAKWSLTIYAQTPEQVRDWWRKNINTMQRIGIVTLGEDSKVIPSPASDEIINFCKTLTAKLERGS